VLGTEPEIRETYVKTGQVVLIFAPVLNHNDRSDQTHQAAECAYEQGQFWKFHNILFENQGMTWRGDVREVVKQLAAEAGLDGVAFNACIDEQRYYDLVKEQDEIRLQAGIRGQPVFFINGDWLAGPQPFEAFANIIDAKLAEQ
jgi:protein-disulfide isomerase